MSFTPYDRPVRSAFVGLGRIYDLKVRGLLVRRDIGTVEVTGLERAADVRKVIVCYKNPDGSLGGRGPCDHGFESPLER